MKRLLTLLEQRTLGAMMSMGFAALIVIFIGLGITSVYSQLQQTRKVMFMHKHFTRIIIKVKNIQISYAHIGRSLRQAIIAVDAGGRDLALKQLAQHRSEMSRNLEELRPDVLRPERRKLLDQIEDRLAHYLRDVDKALELLNQNRNAEAQAFIVNAQFNKAGVDANDMLNEGARLAEESLNQGNLDAERQAQSNLILTAGLLLVSALVGLLIALLVVRSIRRPHYGILDSVQQLANGKLDQPVPYTDYPNEIGELARSTEILRGESIKLEGERWLKTHLAAITNVLQSAGSFSQLAQKLFSNVAPLIHLGHGVFYIYEEEQQKLRLLCGYAQSERKNLDQYFALGQGLVGQCALERAPIIIGQPPADYIRISSGMGTAAPKMIAVIPVLNGSRLLAVIELATYEIFSEKEQALLDALMPIMAMSLDILDRNVKTQRLLEETQRQTEGMELQAARLEEQAIEMQAQQAALAENEQNMRYIFDTSPLNIAYSIQGKWGFSNKMAVETMGLTVGEPSPDMYVNLEDRAALIEIVKSEGIAKNREVQLYDRNRQPRDMLVTFLPIRFGGGEGILGWMEDITERKKAVENGQPKAE